MTLAPRSQSRIFKSSPRSQWAFGSKSKARGVPQRRTSTLSFSSAPIGTESWGVFGRTVMMAVSWSSISANSASRDLMSVERVCMAAILSSAFSLLRLAWAISAETVLRLALSSSTVTRIWRRFWSKSLIWFRVWVATPRWASLAATASKSARIRLISSIEASLGIKKHTRKLLER